MVTSSTKIGISMIIVSEDTPPTFPNNSDIYLAWCHSRFYDHETESRCFHIAKTINDLISNK